MASASEKKAMRPRVVDSPGYAYYWRSRSSKRARVEDSKLHAHLNLNPPLQDPNYLLRTSRREILRRWVADLPPTRLRVLDVGGRIQTFRPLLNGREFHYVSLDPIMEGVLDVLGVAEKLPFPSGAFDVVLCTQVLGYVPDPREACREMHRVLGPGGVLLLSAPAIFPTYFDHLWQFEPSGLQMLLSDFAEVEFEPEVGSVAGLFCILNLFFETFVPPGRGRRLLDLIVFPTSNRLARFLDRFSGENARLCPTYSCRARKAGADFGTA